MGIIQNGKDRRHNILIKIVVHDQILDATLTITYLLFASNIRVRLRGANFPILDQEIDETLLTR